MLAPAAEARFNACTWVAAALLAQVQSAGLQMPADLPAAPPGDRSAATNAYDAMKRAQSFSVMLHKLGHTDAAAGLPPHYELLYWLGW